MKHLQKNVLGIIPARYASTRFPGKPLAMIRGKTMIRRVYEQVAEVLDRLWVATDDERIAGEVEKFGGRVCLTSTSHPSGTDRCAEALELIEKQTGERFETVVNIQGDEPFIQPGQIREILDCFIQEGTQIATLARKADNMEEISDRNLPKVVVNPRHLAMYFSRSPIPYVCNQSRQNWPKKHMFLLHVGMYAFEASVLREISKLSPSPLEQAESLEQLRWLENGYTIRVGLTRFLNRPVDTPEDLERLLEEGFS
ncbi:MAG TPA: 3-deoxy-manno-octulosonate cytidylyltransferase [Bacteroidetes bacterium]|nr:3-deoxy-manno-octulosonate cytidylyltransferase [Bacteroidota bacterium]